MFKRLFLTTAALLIILTGPAIAEQETERSTALKVQVRSLDAKFIGTGVGGLNVSIIDLETGAVLDQGRIEGATGNTGDMMTTGQTRGLTPSAPASASWTAHLAIDEPTQVAIEVTGPLDVAGSIRHQRTSFWMLPGVDRVDPPLVLHLPGLIVDAVAIDAEEAALQITSAVTMLCGCPINEDGLWRAGDFSVRALLYRGDEVVATTDLAFTGTTNQFAGRMEGLEAGDYRLFLTAHQHSTANTGVFEQPIRLP
ncbi:hypothetical protein [Wenzhouxiangella marina]|uniref:Uncharacterized protein n=1 Tax=Wenzhouxiangella marina TaxID=1579979 RepID=A0A0K0XWD6_9GAMM|nr:hypothetical protein [Wenzhouxiangella marina]AKS41985.1 hypothetical protein WM2015_1615 [Wenzhouxiangella marina]MBB6086248.1 hypothetical protein [Wenzhouxiangella marina]